MLGKLFWFMEAPSHNLQELLLTSCKILQHCYWRLVESNPWWVNAVLTGKGGSTQYQAGGHNVSLIHAYCRWWNIQSFCNWQTNLTNLCLSLLLRKAGSYRRSFLYPVMLPKRNLIQLQIVLLGVLFLFCSESARTLSLPGLWVCMLLPHSKDMNDAVDVSVMVVSLYVLALRYTGDLSRMYSASSTMTATLKWISRRKQVLAVCALQTAIKVGMLAWSWHNFFEAGDALTERQTRLTQILSDQCKVTEQRFVQSVSS